MNYRCVFPINIGKNVLNGDSPFVLQTEHTPAYTCHAKCTTISKPIYHWQENLFNIKCVRTIGRCIVLNVDREVLFIEVFPKIDFNLGLFLSLAENLFNLVALDIPRGSNFFDLYSLLFCH